MTVQRHEWADGWFETITMRPHESVQPWVIGEYTAWTEQTTRRVTRVETACAFVPLILNFGPRYSIAPGVASTTHDRQRAESHASFVAGLYDRWVTVESENTSCAMQVNFTPFGAHLLLGVSMRELCSRSVGVDVALGTEGAALVEQLGNERTWAARFARLDAFLRSRVARALQASTIPDGMQTAWQMLSNAGGDVRINALAAATGWSTKRLIAEVREYTGLSPKRLARVMRFERTLRHIHTNDHVAWTQRALDSGYYDQAHLIRDFGEFAGCTPTDYLRRRLPPGGGVLGDVA